MCQSIIWRVQWLYMKKSYSLLSSILPPLIVICRKSRLETNECTDLFFVLLFSIPNPTFVFYGKHAKLFIIKNFLFFTIIITMQYFHFLLFTRPNHYIYVTFYIIIIRRLLLFLTDEQ